MKTWIERSHGSNDFTYRSFANQRAKASSEGVSLCSAKPAPNEARLLFDFSSSVDLYGTGRSAGLTNTKSDDQFLQASFTNRDNLSKFELRSELAINCNRPRSTNSRMTRAPVHEYVGRQDQSINYHSDNNSINLSDSVGASIRLGQL
ncbi:hypothetical protein Pst134EA_020833 [Puccinia striiformis f. sp. tritici]|uniref:hypothetical protein n=1 Tax=Puccinia striiformis f. sp. tritici TaxID=168172 RepID=UPI002007FCC6|nr:hypothetical protein Pst134EA_020833 [Puccinia striiformis f. sp. tritici]KAH9456925.1 hypothetical protein Pst134EA_020833 [Puccinia striiformis f. sp. tritici]